VYRHAFVSLCLAAVAVAAPLQVQAQDADVPKELLKARLEAVRQVFKAAKHEQEAGRGLFEDLPLWSRRLLEAERALATTKEEHLTACREHLKRMQEFEELEKARYEAGRTNIKTYAAATYHRTDAEITLARAQAMK
jgi:hypothetical protein